jgi:hypothetical protein
MDLYLWIEALGPSTWVREAPTVWGYPTVLTLHTFGMSVLVGTSAVLSLRILGVGGSIPLAPLRTLFPVVWVGWWVSFVTGALLFGAAATVRGMQGLFLAKLLIVAAGTAIVVLIKRQGYGPNADQVAVSRTTRHLALLLLLVWVVAITAGRLLAYVT